MNRPSLARRACVALAALAAFAIGAPALAQSGPLKLIVPYAPGGPVDVQARLLAPSLQAVLKENVIVENRPGAGSLIGARQVANAPADGRTVLIGNLSTFAIGPATTANPGYDPLKSFTSLGLIADASTAIVVPASFTGSTMNDLIAMAKANRNKVSYGSPGVGNASHLIGELLQSGSHAPMTHVPYRSGAEVMTAVMAGQITFAAVDLTTSLNSIREGKLKALAVSGPTRSPDLPNVPTVAEAGYPSVQMKNWTGAAVRAGTPKDVVARLEDAIKRAAAAPDYEAAVRRMGAQVRHGSGDEMAALVAADYKRWADVARQAGIKLE